MASLTIKELVRQSLTEGTAPDTDVDDTYIAAAEIVFEKITFEDVTIASDTTGDTSWDLAIAYLTLSIYYAVMKEGYMTGSGDERVPAHVWWEQTAFRFIASIGYSEFLMYDKIRGMYYVKGKQPRVADLMAVKVMTGDPDVI
jgi:hypothetical protein